MRAHRRALAALALAALGAAAPAQAQMRDLPMPIPPSQEGARISVVSAPGITHTDQLPPHLRPLRKRMMAGERMAPDALRALAERREGLAAQRLVRHLLARDPAAHASDIAYFGAIAVGTGRIWTLPDAIAAMHRLDPGTEAADRKAEYISMLYAHAWAGNTLALDAVIDLNGEGRLFGPLSEATHQRILQQAARNGDGRIELRLALNLLRDPSPSPDDMALARRYLSRAEVAGLPAVRATAAGLRAVLGPAGQPAEAAQ